MKTNKKDLPIGYLAVAVGRLGARRDHQREVCMKF